MALYAHTDITLAALPVDIIRTIIQMEKPELIDDLRLISSSWNFLVTEFLNDKKRLPVIDNRLCYSNGNGVQYNDYLTHVRIFRKQHHVTYKDYKHQVIGRKRKLESTDLNIRIASAIKRCSSIDKLSLDLTDVDITMLCRVHKYLGTTHIRLLNIRKLRKYSLNSAYMMFQILQDHKVQELEISDVCNPIFDAFLQYFFDYGYYNGLKTIRICDNFAPSAAKIQVWKEYVESFNQSGKGVAQFYYDEHRTIQSKNCVRVHITPDPIFKPSHRNHS